MVEPKAPSSIDQVVEEFMRAFSGLDVEGMDLAGANRLSFFLAVQAREAFASPKLGERAREALLGRLVFARERWRGRGRTPALARAAEPKVLFFMEGGNPSVDNTVRNLLRLFSPAEARVAIVNEADAGPSNGYEWIFVRRLLPEGVAGALGDLPRALAARQREAATPLLRRASLRAWLLRHSLRTAAAARAFEALFDAYPASAVVTASDTLFWGRCATLAARRRGIPSLTLQHGMMVGEAAYVPVISDRFAAWGEGSARWLLDRGVPAAQIAVTGAPRLDDIVNRPRRPRAEVAAAIRANPAPRWALLATNPIPFELNAAMLAIARTGVRAWDAQAILLVKLHPSEDPAPYQAAVAGDANVRVVPHGAIDLYDLIHAADAVLTFHSSVGLEAMILGKPVVSLEAFGEANPLDYARAGAAAAARDGNELARALAEDVPPGPRAQLRQAARERFVRENMLADGKCAERARELVRDLASGSEARPAGSSGARS